MKPTTTPFLTRYNQTLIPACLLLLTGGLIAANVTWPPVFWVIWSVVAICAAVLIVLFARQGVTLRWFVWLGVLFLGGLYFQNVHFHPAYNNIGKFGERSQVDIVGTVTDMGAQPDRLSFEVTRLNQMAVSGKVLLRLKDISVPDGIDIGSRLLIRGDLHKPFTPQFPGDFNYAAYLLQSRITGILSAHQVSVQSTQPPTAWLRVLQSARHIRLRMNQLFEAHLAAPDGAIYASIFLGDHAVEIDPDIKTDFIRAGLIHVLAASGFNVSLIGFLFIALAAAFRVPWRIGTIVAMVAVLFYCLLTGLPASVLRAGMMLELALFLRLLNRQLTPLLLLCLAGVILFLAYPETVLALGFQLSFITAFGLLAMMTPIEARLGFYATRWLVGLIMVPVVAQIWVMPLIWAYFNQVQVLGLPANLLALPVVAILTYLGFLLALLGLIWPAGAGWGIAHTGSLVTLLRLLTQGISHVPGAIWTIAAPPWPVTVLLLGMLCFIAYWLWFPGALSRRVGALSITALLIGALLPLGILKWQAAHQVTLTWLPGYSGQNGVQIIEAPHAVLISAGTMTRGMGYSLASYCKHRGLTRVDLLTLTSARLHTVAGLQVLKRSVDIQTIALGGLISRDAQAQFVDFASRTHIPIHMLGTTDVVRNGLITGQFYTFYPTGLIQRFDYRNQCTALLWGTVPLKPDQQNAMTKGCTLVYRVIPGDVPQLQYENSIISTPLNEFTQFDWIPSARGGRPFKRPLKRG